MIAIFPPFSICAAAPAHIGRKAFRHTQAARRYAHTATAE